jgi:hypothetical protein
MKKGRVEIAPKRASLVKANNLNKVTISSPSFPHILILNDEQRLGAQLAAGTERHLAQKAGHLELLAGGKKDKKKATDAKK